jgi:hypothetical protein
VKTLTVLCNIVLLGFTGLVLVTDGLPKEVPYIVFTMLLLLGPVFTVFVIVRSRTGDGTALWRAAATCNVILLGFIGWAIVDQYPHPDEEGFIEYVVLVVFTPLLNAAVLLHGDRVQRRRSLQATSGAPQP